MRSQEVPELWSSSTARRGSSSFVKRVAAELFRACRRDRETPRSLADCLIAAVAIRSGVVVLCRDSDFGVIARHTPLRLAEL